MPGTRKLGKTTAQRKAMLRQQVTDFLDKGKMETTLTRCKEVAPLAEKMITLGKKNDLAAYRQAMSFITKEDVVKKLFKEIAPSYAERNGGYTRITRTGVRRGDASETAMIELVKQISVCFSGGKAGHDRRCHWPLPRPGNSTQFMAFMGAGDPPPYKRPLLYGAPAGTYKRGFFLFY